MLKPFLLKNSSGTIEHIPGESGGSYRYIRVMRAVLKKSWIQQPKKEQLYGHLLPIGQTIQVKHAEHCWRS